MFISICIKALKLNYTFLPYITNKKITDVLLQIRICLIMKSYVKPLIIVSSLSLFIGYVMLYQAENVSNSYKVFIAPELNITVSFIISTCLLS